MGQSMGEPATTSSNPLSAFRELHASGCFVIPNPWDIGSAVCLHHLGFRALATSSAGLAFTLGLPDTAVAVSRDVTLAHLRDIVTATPLPVNADFQSGFGTDPDGVADSVTRCVETGVAGLSIEDATGDAAAPLFDAATALARVRAARAAIDATGRAVVLTARCEAVLIGYPDARRVALERSVAFADAGADCLFAPGVQDAEGIAAIVAAVAPKPVNVLVNGAVPGLSLQRLAELGVRRVSVGSALARVAFGAFLEAAREIQDTGSFARLAGGAPFAQLNAIFGPRSRTTET